MTSPPCCLVNPIKREGLPVFRQNDCLHFLARNAHSLSGDIQSDSISKETVYLVAQSDFDACECVGTGSPPPPLAYATCPSEAIRDVNRRTPKQSEYLYEVR